MTIPSTQGQAGEDLNGMPVHRLPLVSTAASRHARSWGTRPGHERPPGHAALRALPRRGQVRGLLLVVRRQHGRRARRGGSGTGRAPSARGQDAQSLRYVSSRAICARGWERPCARGRDAAGGPGQAVLSVGRDGGRRCPRCRRGHRAAGRARGANRGISAVPPPRGGLCPSPHGCEAPASPQGTRILNSPEKLDFNFFFFLVFPALFCALRFCSLHS